MSLRHVLASLALVPALAVPVAAHASTADGPGVLPQKTHFDLQAHRGGIGMTTEESLEGFGKAMRLRSTSGSVLSPSGSTASRAPRTSGGLTSPR